MVDRCSDVSSDLLNVVQRSPTLCYEQPLTTKPTFAGMRTLSARVAELGPIAQALFAILVDLQQAAGQSAFPVRLTTLTQRLGIKDSREERLHVWELIEHMASWRLSETIETNRANASARYGPLLTIMQATVVTAMHGRTLVDVRDLLLVMSNWAGASYPVQSSVVAGS